jgi:heptosyltransferase-2
MSLPALRVLRSAFPNTHLAVQARPWVASLYRRERCVDEVILYEARPSAWDWKGKWRAAAQLRSGGFDAAILFTNSFDSALVAWLAGIPCRIGYNRDGRRLLLTRPVATPRAGEIPRHESYYYLELLRRTGWLEDLPVLGPVVLEEVEEARTSGKKLLAAAGMKFPVVGVSPGAAYGSAKRWLPERFAESAVLVASELGANVAIFGSATEQAICEVVASKISSAGISVRSFAGQTALDVFIDMAAACCLFLSNDSGAMHVASALGVPVVAVFGPTNYHATGPIGRQSRVVVEPVECSPCGLRECPFDHRCMTGISAARVAREALALLK